MCPHGVVVADLLRQDPEPSDHDPRNSGSIRRMRRMSFGRDTSSAAHLAHFATGVSTRPLLAYRCDAPAGPSPGLRSSLAPYERDSSTFMRLPAIRVVRVPAM